MRGNGYRPSMKIGPDVLYVHRDARVANEHLADVEAVAVGEVVSPMEYGAQHVRIRSDGTIHIEFAFAVAELLPRSTIQFSIAGIREAGLTFPFLPEGGSTVECNLPGGTLTAWDCCSFSVRVFDEWGGPPGVGDFGGLRTSTRSFGRKHSSWTWLTPTASTMGAIVNMNRTRVCAQVLGTLRARKGTRKWNTPIQK